MVTGFEGGEGIMKINKKELLLTSLVCLLPLLAGVALYPRLPETMATHWGFDGTANGWSSRAATVPCRCLFWRCTSSAFTPRATGRTGI